MVSFPVEYSGKMWPSQATCPLDMPGELPSQNLQYSVSEKALYYDFPNAVDFAAADHGNHNGKLELRCPTIWADNEYHTIVVENKVTEEASIYNWSKITIDGVDISNQFVEGSTTVRKYVVKQEG